MCKAGALAVALVCVPLLAMLPQRAPAQSAPEPASAEAIEALAAELEDDARREALVTDLRALAAARRATAETVEERPSSLGARALGLVAERLEAASSKLTAAAGALLEVPSATLAAAAAMRDAERRRKALALLGAIAATLAAGLAAEWLIRLILKGPRQGLETREHETLWLRVPLLFGRTVLDLAAILAFALAAYGLLSLLDPDPLARLVAIALINASVLSRAVLAVARMALAPGAARLRLARMSDEGANYWYLWARRLTHVSIWGYFVAEAALVLGLSAELHDLALDLLGLVVTAMLAILVQQNREHIAALVRGGEGRGRVAQTLRDRLADLWHVLAILYLVAVYVVWAMEVPDGFRFIARATVLTVVIVVFASVLNAGLRRGVDRLFALSEEMRDRFPTLEERANRYVPWLKTLGGTLVLAVAALSLLEAWGLETFAWLGGEAGRRLLASGVTIACIVGGALVVWELVSSAIERYIRRQEEAGQVAASARTLTLLPLARKVLFALLVVMVTLTVLSELGVNIGPLLAGAGVVGLAVGFGAQTLVKDVITGVFILVEDSIAVGDFIEVGGHAGTVESMSMRTIRLRDVSGHVHTVPFSEVTSVLNYTREFAYALIDVGVAYREDADHVMQVLTEVGAELEADPEWRIHVLEPLQVMGVQELADSAVVVRARIKTVAGMQWATRREFLRRIKRRFDELGIEIPFPHRTLYFGADQAGAAPPARVRLERGQTIGDGVGGEGVGGDGVGREGVGDRAAPGLVQPPGGSPSS